MTPYHKLYLQDISELQRMLFEEITRYEYEIDFPFFVEGYMNCDYRAWLDKGNPRVANMTWDELLSYLELNCSDIIRKGETNIDRLQAGWIGRMYSLLQYELNVSSAELYKRLPLEKMQIMFRPLHTVSEEVALEKITSNCG